MPNPKLSAKAKAQKRAADGKFGSGGSKSAGGRSKTPSAGWQQRDVATLDKLVKKYGSAEAASRSPEWKATETFKQARKRMRSKTSAKRVSRR